ncbi:MULTISPECIES: DUF4381 domain-containing protein [Pseudomonas]|uniref:DUF4381 domain-containing protein n=1 Tax=Pseudomonas TaxID=286 RepID=UPI000CFED5CF|nr:MULTISPECIES: DUF4381 domain-containing protein [Pseudomonas]PRA52000.1 hypothetical protein CQZ98_17690 [Pseudomonas sp. MYb115]QXN51343.1 DUF4381 domain-containing protein [Pseudomonas fluorescens]WSO25661.1 DUF4381 domain-containing protein [Pseudomonas fluorescens]
MNPNIPSIDQLKEMALPTPISYAPQTWGWWALLGLLVLAVVLVSVRRYWQWRRDRYRREALLRFAELQQRGNDLNALRELPELLKRVALSMPATASVGASLLAKASRQPTSMSNVRASSRAGSLLPGSPAALGKEDWQAFLQQHSKQPLPADFSLQLSLLAYAPDATLLALPNEQREALFSTCKNWVEHHHVAA